jgi:hydroxymethylglutaryl-CoA reductase
MSPTIPDFSKLSFAERRDFLKEFAKLTDEELRAFRSPGGLGLESADRMIENVVGLVPVPMGIATGFLINGKGIHRAHSDGAEDHPNNGDPGREADTGDRGLQGREHESPTMIGQMQFTRVPDFDEARRRILANKEEILRLANTLSKTRRAFGLEVRRLETSAGAMLIVELLVDVRDSMGANVVDSMCESVAPLIESLSGGIGGLDRVQPRNEETGSR